MIPQFGQASFRGSRDNLGIGLAMLIFGLCENHLAAVPAFYADKAYDGVLHALPSTTYDCWLGTLAFALQIYFDFSSYSNMAIGLARIFGVRFPSNFDSPYCATSVIHFLGKMAPDSDAVFEGIRLFPLRRKSSGAPPPIREHHDHHVPQRALAWGGMDLCHLGAASRNVSGAHSSMAIARAKTVMEP